MFDYLRDPKAIYEKSFATIQSETDFSGFDLATRTLATRIIHACGMPEITSDLAYSPDITSSAITALKKQAPILCDCEMVTHGVIRRFLPVQNEVICTLNQDGVPQIAARLGTTRSAAAVELWLEQLGGSIVVIGNAPTALFHLLERLNAGAPRPAVILAFPVGFVGAAESKEALITHNHGVPYITLRGRKGGSAMAAAALNALAGLSGQTE